MTQKSIGFVGLGNLGLPMVANLLAHSQPVTVYDSDQARVTMAVDAGATPASDLRDLAGCDLLCLAVPDGAAVSTVLLDEGVLEGLPNGATVLVHSTVLPAIAPTRHR